MKNTGILILLRNLIIHHPLRLGLIMLMMTVVGFAQGLGIALLSPLLTLVGFQGISSSGRLITLLTSLLQTIGLPLTIKTVLGLFMGIVILENSLKFIQVFITRKFISCFVMDLRLSLYDAYLKSTWYHWLDKHIGPMTSRLTEEMARVEEALTALLNFLSDAMNVGVLFVVAFIFSWPLTLFFFIGGGLLVFAMQFRFFQRNKSGQDISTLKHALQEVVHEHLGGIKLIKASSLEEQSLATYEKASRELTKTGDTGYIDIYRMSLFFNPLIVGLLCIGLYSSINLMHLPPAKAIVIIFILFRLATRLTSLQQQGRNILLFSPAYAFIQHDIRNARENAEQKNLNTKVSCPPLGHGIILNRVQFGYKPLQPVIKDLSLEIRNGDMIGLVGRSGCGKSTVLDLIVGLLNPQQGQITIDGRPLFDMDLPSWRSQIGYVGQETVLFYDTIFNNIRWANPSATPDDVKKAAEMAQVNQFAENLPQGYDTLVGNRGIQLSGGERQRVALARALVRHPRLLLLDEATSALDASSESLVQQAIDQLQNQMTILVVTHRLATVRNTHKIFVLDNGNLVQEGTWQTLNQTTGVFADLLNHQLHNRHEKNASPTTEALR